MLLIVSVMVWLVSVWLLILPWVKFGTTGTAMAGASVTLTPTTDITDQYIVFPKRVIPNTPSQ